MSRPRHCSKVCRLCHGYHSGFLWQTYKLFVTGSPALHSYGILQPVNTCEPQQSAALLALGELWACPSPCEHAHYYDDASDSAITWCRWPIWRRSARWSGTRTIYSQPCLRCCKTPVLLWSHVRRSMRQMSNLSANKFNKRRGIEIHHYLERWRILTNFIIMTMAERQKPQYVLCDDITMRRISAIYLTGDFLPTLYIGKKRKCENDSSFLLLVYLSFRLITVPSHARSHVGVSQLVYIVHFFH